MSIFTPAAVEEQGRATAMAHRLIDRVEAMVGRAPGKFAIPHSVADVQRQREAGLISLALGMENGVLAKLQSKEYVCIMAPDDDDDDADDTESE